MQRSAVVWSQSLPLLPPLFLAKPGNPHSCSLQLDSQISKGHRQCGPTCHHHCAQLTQAGRQPQSCSYPTQLQEAEGALGLSGDSASTGWVCTFCTRSLTFPSMSPTGQEQAVKEKNLSPSSPHHCCWLWLAQAHRETQSLSSCRQQGLATHRVSGSARNSGSSMQTSKSSMQVPPSNEWSLGQCWIPLERGGQAGSTCWKEEPACLPTWGRPRPIPPRLPCQLWTAEATCKCLSSYACSLPSSRVLLATGVSSLISVWEAIHHTLL